MESLLDDNIVFTKRKTEELNITTTTSPPERPVAVAPDSAPTSPRRDKISQDKSDTTIDRSTLRTPPSLGGLTDGLNSARPRRESRSVKRHYLLVSVDSPEKSSGVKFYTINVGTDLPKYTTLMQGSETWTVRRRYNHFRALFENISTQRDLGVLTHDNLHLTVLDLVSLPRARFLAH